MVHERFDVTTPLVHDGAGDAVAGALGRGAGLRQEALHDRREPGAHRGSEVVGVQDLRPGRVELDEGQARIGAADVTGKTIMGPEHHE